MSLHKTLSVAAAAMLVAAPAAAHTGAAAGAGLAHGFAHPLGGLDHLLAMVTVGVWAAQRGGRAVWALPAAFVGMMLAGGSLGLSGVALPGVEGAVLASVIVLGAVVALAARPGLPLGLAIVGAFGLFHGQAHGAEMPAAAAPALYAAGFVAATALLHAAGVGAALAARRGLLLRAAGAAVAASGVVLAAA